MSGVHDYAEENRRRLVFALETISKLAKDRPTSGDPHAAEKREQTLKFIAAIADEASGANIPF